MKRIICISAMTIFLCSCGGETEQQATNIQAPPSVGTNTPPVESDEARSADSKSATNRKRPARDEPVENADTNSSAGEEVDRPEMPDNSESAKPDDKKESPDVSDSTDVVRPDDKPKTTRGQNPKPAEMFAAFPSPSGTVGLKTGNLIPEISGTDLEGVDFKLSDYKGKVIMLDFWGDW